MTEIYLLYILSLLQYYCCKVFKEFQGSSQTSRFYIGACGIISRLIYLALFVWSFFLFDWYVPAIMFVASITTSTLPFYLDSVAMRLIAPAVTVILAFVLLYMYFTYEPPITL